MRRRDDGWAGRGGTMAAAGTKKWAKFPRFVEYANARERFQEKTPANMQWAQDLSIPLLGRSSGSVRTPEDVWEVLRAHQPGFHQFLDAIIGSRDKPTLITREMMQTLTEHCAHMVLESRWDWTPAKIREQEAQRDTMKAAARRAAMRDRLAAKWGVPESELPIVPPPPRTPPPRYHEKWTPTDPLDGFYWDLREFLRRGQPERLQKCPVCQRYFVQVTARSQTYCDTPCRLKGNATQRERNAAYVRRHREKQIRADLSKVREAKVQLRAVGAKELELKWVLEEAGITKRRYNTLRQWEQKRYGKPRATALP
jgi:Family of unknown function (DUF6076)